MARVGKPNSSHLGAERSPRQRGIRTPATARRGTAYQAAAFVHSAICPCLDGTLEADHNRLSAPNKTAAQVGEKAGWLRAMGSSRRSA
jgi:hypothetical protein